MLQTYERTQILQSCETRHKNWYKVIF